MRLNGDVPLINIDAIPDGIVSVYKDANEYADKLAQDRQAKLQDDAARDLAKKNSDAQLEQKNQCPPLPDSANEYVQPVVGQDVSRALGSSFQMECVAGSHLEVDGDSKSLAESKFWLDCLNDPKSTKQPIQWMYRDVPDEFLVFPSRNIKAPVCVPHCETP
eukprot:416506_1